MVGDFNRDFNFDFDVGPVYRFLIDHFITSPTNPSGFFVQAGMVAYMAADYGLGNWNPTADVDPINFQAVQAFYKAGPKLPGLVRQQWTNSLGSQLLTIVRPVTYWFEVGPNLWALSGLGANQGTYPPIHANISRVE